MGRPPDGAWAQVPGEDMLGVLPSQRQVPVLVAFASDGPLRCQGSSALFRAWQGQLAVPGSCGNTWAQLSRGARQLPVDLASVFASLPMVSSALCRFLDEVQSHSDVNKMSVQNLATVFGPNILRPPIEDPVTIMEGNGEGVHGRTGCSGVWAHLGPGKVLRTFMPGQREGWLHHWGLGRSFSGSPPPLPPAPPPPWGQL